MAAPARRRAAVSAAADYLARLAESFDRAVATRGRTDWTLRVGPLAIRIEFAGEALVPVLGRALGHLRTEGRSEAATVFRVWDAESTGAGRPPLDLPGAQVVRGLVPALSEPGRAFAIEGPHAAVSAWDAAARTGYHHVPAAGAVPLYEQAFPLRALLGWAAAAADLQLLHAAAVGTATAGALIAGRGGSGKSGTALAALAAGLRYAGDDYVLAGVSPRPTAFSVYQSAKLHPADLPLFPALARAVAGVDPASAKAVLFLDALEAAPLAASLPLRALIAPRVARAPGTTFTRISAATFLRTLAPSSVLQLPGAEAAEFRRMARLAAAVPAYQADLGADRAEVGATLRTFLEGLA